MRRFLPVLVIVIAVAALAIDFFTIQRPFTDQICAPPTNTQGCIDTRLGLDLQGGLRGEYQALPTADKPVTADNMNTIKTIIENRINQFGVAEPVVQTQGTDRLVVEIPGVSDVDAVRQLIGSTGRLDFVPVPSGTTTISQGTVLGTSLPACAPNTTTFTAPCVLFSGDQVASAAAGTDQTTGQRAVNFTLGSQGTALFANYSRNNVGNQFAIVLEIGRAHV